MPGRELVSKRTRTEFREALSNWGTLRTIDTFFESEGFVPDLSFTPEIGGQRRVSVEQYYRAMDFTDPKETFRLLRVYEEIILEIEKTDAEKAAKLKFCLERDGYRFEKGRLLLKNPNARFSDLRTIAETVDASEILAQIERIEKAIENDPALAIGTAKELVESCCKTILEDRHIEYEHDDDLPKLVRKVQKALKLLPDDVPEQAKGADTIKRMVSNLASLLSGLAEMRNLYGSGHGRHGKHRGLSSRHAKLASGAAGTLAVFLFETHQERP